MNLKHIGEQTKNQKCWLSTYSPISFEAGVLLDTPTERDRS